MTLFWTILTIALIVLEASTAQFICIWFSGGAFAALIVALCGLGLWTQIVVFVLISALLLISTKKFVNKLKSKTSAKTNTDALIGETAVVMSPISNTQGIGSVKIRGMVWTARSEDGSDIEEGTLVLVKQIEGVKLIVSQIDKED